MIKVALDDKAVKTVQKTIGGSSSLYTYFVKTEDDNNYVYGFTFQCDSPELDSYDKLAQYLVSKGYYPHLRDDVDSYYPILSAVSCGTNPNGAVTGLFVDNTSLSDGQLRIGLSTIYISSGELKSHDINVSSNNFKIILVTE